MEKYVGDNVHGREANCEMSDGSASHCRKSKSTLKRNKNMKNAHCQNSKVYIYKRVSTEPCLKVLFNSSNIHTQQIINLFLTTKSYSKNWLIKVLVFCSNILSWKPENHSTKVSKMGNITTSHREPVAPIQCTVSNNHPLALIELEGKGALTEYSGKHATNRAKHHIQPRSPNSRNIHYGKKLLHKRNRFSFVRSWCRIIKPCCSKVDNTR